MRSPLVIPSAPPDFWAQVINRVAELVWQRETGSNSATPYVSTPMLPRSGVTTFSPKEPTG